MNFARSCTSCVRAQPSVRAAFPGRTSSRSFSAFSPSIPAFKKHSKQQAVDFEDEFQEDEFDDVDSSLEQADSAPSTGPGVGREQRFAESLARVERVTSQPHFRLKSNQPSPSLITTLLTQSTAETLPRALELIEQWRNKRLPLLADQAVGVLVKRLTSQDGSRVVTVLADRSKYGVEIKDIKQLYPLFSQFSRPPTPQPAEGQPSPSPSSTCNDLLTLAQQHTPSTSATDSFAHVCTLASVLSASKTPPTTPRIEALVKHLETLGEDYILQQAGQELTERQKLVMRMRAMRITEELRRRQVLEDATEWFAHLTERLVILTK